MGVTTELGKKVLIFYAGIFFQGKKNTIYTYLFLVNSLYRKKTGYSKILKMIYINWCKKNNFSFVTGHVRVGIAKQFSDNTEIVKIFSKWYSAKTPFEYYRRPLK